VYGRRLRLHLHSTQRVMSLRSHSLCNSPVFFTYAYSKPPRLSQMVWGKAEYLLSLNGIILLHRESPLAGQRSALLNLVTTGKQKPFVAIIKLQRIVVGRFIKKTVAYTYEPSGWYNPVRPNGLNTGKMVECCEAARAGSHGVSPDASQAIGTSESVNRCDR
jgi:hypothetical protein